MTTSTLFASTDDPALDNLTIVDHPPGGDDVRVIEAFQSSLYPRPVEEWERVMEHIDMFIALGDAAAYFAWKNERGAA